MGIGCSGEKTWVYGPQGLVCDDAGNVRAVLDAKALGYDGNNARGAVISAHADGGHLVNGEGLLIAFDEAGAVKPVGRRVYALTSIDEKRWAVATREGREVVIRVGLRGAESVRLRSPRDLQKMDVPLLWRGGDTPFTRKKRFSENPGRLRLRAGKGCLALADADSGIVALWREGLMDWSLSFRLPSTERSELEAHPWNDGLLVALRSDSGRGCLVCFDADGQVEHTLQVDDLGPSALRDKAVIYTDGPTLRRWVPGAEPDTVLEGEYLNEGGEIVASPDGRYLFQYERRAYWLEPGEAKWHARPLPEPEDAAAPMVLAKVVLPRKKKSPPQIELDAMIEPAPWTLTQGEGALVFPLVMTGGPAADLVIEVAGPGAKLFEPEAAVLDRHDGSQQVAFEAHKVRIPCELPAGVEVPDPPKSVARRKADAKTWRWEQHPQDCRMTLKILGKAKKGSSLLTVRISFGEHGRTGSLLRGQMLTVT